jgi:hypothetical protein
VGSATSAVAFQLGKDDQALGRGKLWVARGQDEFPGASPDHDVAGVGLNDPLSGHRVDEVSPLRLGDDPVSGLEPVEVPERCSVCRPVTGHDDPAVLPRPGLFEVGAKRFFEAAATRGVVARSLAEVFGTNPFGYDLRQVDGGDLQPEDGPARAGTEASRRTRAIPRTGGDGRESRSTSELLFKLVLLTSRI